MTSALKFGVKEFVHDGFGRFVVDKSSRHYQNVGIVVLAGHFGNFGSPAQSGADVGVLVERHAHALARTANTDTLLAFALFDAFGQLMGEVGIVATFFAKTTVVSIGHLMTVQIFFDKLF